MVLRGTIRFVVLLALLAAVTAAVAALVVWLHGSDPHRTYDRTFYIVGALVAAAGFSIGVAYVALGVALFAIGALFEIVM